MNLGTAIASTDISGSRCSPYTQTKNTSCSLASPFRQLANETNIKETPHNWLRNKNVAESILRNYVMKKDNFISSLIMAHQWLEIVDKIDIISDYRNVKSLLKMAYSSKPVSIIVHKIGDTFLFDNFDVYHYLLNQQKSEWKWMQRFCYDQLLRGHNEKMSLPSSYISHFKPDRSRQHLESNRMLSKFLYHTINGSSDNKSKFPDECSEASSSEESTEMQSPLCTFCEFADFKMLIGTDLPIFSSGAHPCISLRLAEMNKPIHVLSGLDYWLDNLMCNVPELAMCFHVDGIVQKYEIIKTEDIPNFCTPSYSPHEVESVMQNIFSFLKSKVTCEGHTYWLFKEPESDIVKLYDLTSLCADYFESSDENQFTLPVAALLYRIAHNLFKSGEWRSQTSVINRLLNSCLEILDSDKHSDLYTATLYLLAHLHSELDQATFAADFCIDEEPISSTQELLLTSRGKKTSSKIAIRELLSSPRKFMMNLEGDTINHLSFRTAMESSLRSLEYIWEALKIMNDRSNNKNSPSELEGDSSLLPTSKDLMPVNESHIIEVDNIPNKSFMMSLTISIPNPLHGDPSFKLRYGLYYDAARSYLTLAESTISSENYGEALLFIKIGLMCLACCTKSLEKHITVAKVLFFYYAADCHVLIAKKISGGVEKFYHKFETTSSLHNSILNSVDSLSLKHDFSWVTNPKDISKIGLFTLSCKLYEECVKNSKRTSKSYKHYSSRLGNSLNELGSIYMKDVSDLLKDVTEINDTLDSELHEKLCASQKILKQGLQTFSRISDRINEALVHCNLGKCYRMFARKSELLNDGSCMETYKQAIDEYESALVLTTSRHRNADKNDTKKQLRDCIHWELSCTYFTLGTFIQDHPSPDNDQDTQEREVADYMRKASKFTELAAILSRELTCKYRLATSKLQMKMLL